MSGKQTKRKKKEAELVDMQAEPGQRLYQIPTEVNGKVELVTVKEENLSKEQMQHLGKMLIHYFEYQPDPVQDMLINYIEYKINIGRERMETGDKMLQVAAQAGLIDDGTGPQVSTGGIIMPGSNNPGGGKIITNF